MHTYIHTYIHTYMFSIYIYTYIYIDIYIHEHIYLCTYRVRHLSNKGPHKKGIRSERTTCREVCEPDIDGLANLGFRV